MPDDRPAAKPGGLKQSLIYFGTVVAGQGVAFLLLPFITRAMEPSEYGNYSLALAVSSLIAMFASSWLRNVAMRVYFEARQIGRSRGFFLGIAITQAASLAVLYVLALVVLALFDISPAPISALISAGISMIIGDLTALTATLLRAEQRSTAFAVSEIGTGVIRFICTVGGLALGFTTSEMLFHATSIGLAVAGVYSISKLYPRLEGPSSPDWMLVNRVVRHGPGALPFSVAEWAEQLVDRLIIERFFGSAVVGIYSIGYTLGERTVGLVVNAVYMMAWPAIIAAWQDEGKENARRAVLDAQRLHLWFTTGPTAFLLAYGGSLLELFAGPKYYEAAPLVPIVAASMWLAGFSKYLNRHMELNKRFSLLSGTRMITAAINLALNLILIPGFGMLGAAWATLSSRAFGFVMYLFLRDPTVTPIPFAPLARAAAWSAVCWLLPHVLGLGVVAGMAVFIVLYAPVALFALRKLKTL